MIQRTNDAEPNDGAAKTNVEKQIKRNEENMPNYITHVGFDKIQNEIENIQKLLKGDVAKKIGEARALGDLKENAEYHAMKDKQRLLATRMEELSQMLSGAEIIENLDLPAGKVTVGKKVYLRNLDKDRMDIYTILGPVESDVDNDIISYETPIARQLMMKEEGETVDVQVPIGTIRYKIEKIEPYDPADINQKSDDPLPF
ncbi:MAG TPA: transcription elongation factor GreA [Bacteroidetes bacterium]|nr:transcription elongation factor GreA [Bacteroidota bacterium]